MKVLICGSRAWNDPRPIWKLLEYLADSEYEYEIIHGAAPGADTIAGFVAEALGLRVTSIPADWSRYGKAAGPFRNQQMLDLKPDRVVAFRMPGTSRGTDDMILKAVKAKVPVTVIDINGERKDL